MECANHLLEIELMPIPPQINTLLLENHEIKNENKWFTSVGVKSYRSVLLIFDGKYAFCKYKVGNQSIL